MTCKVNKANQARLTIVQLKGFFVNVSGDKGTKCGHNLKLVMLVSSVGSIINTKIECQKIKILKTSLVTSSYELNSRTKQALLEQNLDLKLELPTTTPLNTKSECLFI